MTTQLAVFIESRDCPTTATDLYTSTSVYSTIDKFTATNTTGTAATISVNLVPPSGSVGSSNLITQTVSILPGQSYLFPELTGQVISPGSKINATASTSGITVRASGRITTI